MQHTEITCVRNRSCQSIIVNRSNHSFRLIQKILIHHEKHVVNYRVVKNTALRMLNVGECLPLTRFGQTHCCFNQFLHGEHILDQKSQKEPFSGYILSGPHYLTVDHSGPNGPKCSTWSMYPFPIAFESMKDLFHQIFAQLYVVESFYFPKPPACVLVSSLSNISIPYGRIWAVYISGRDSISAPF